MQTLHARAMKEMFLLASLALLSRVHSTGFTADYEYVWNTREQNRCIEIPEDLRLCHGIGYPRMLLPNLLEHDSVAEVKQQAGSWVPLVHRRCHPGTQVFLCSLFASVCLEKPVYPCQQLCESVRDACSPIMESFGFLWPEMFKCDRFPHEENEMCINGNLSSNPDVPEPKAACPQCDIGMNTDFILENMCASEFAIKAKVKKTKTQNMDKKVILQRKKKTVWNKNQSIREPKKLMLYLKNGALCPCEQLDNKKDHYLIMVRKVDERYLLTGIHQWDEERSEFQKLLNQIKTHKCSALDSIFK
ncbi:hypothetical protein Q7C36_020276 [Tachysurus vachellii]|uniref:Secreted frizzled-related protein 1 n=1 Tax=Tachysurus vachellii TaxID=175792 RepID=A0AA88LTC7_TACVA|nr:secreted frizzled-related protein 1b [Tachysurus vachellii]KAK2823676.1 hypothetical protein Q7C36_020276 [Tachysurus vachellii]